MSEKLGIETKQKDDFSAWYLEVVRKAEFVDQRSPTKGFDVIMPWGYAVWEHIQKIFDALIKEKGVVNAYFPLLIPERIIQTEEKHLEGFKAETAIVTKAGGEDLEEPLYIRPTSETIMYYMYALWIRSHNDLPLLINQWNNVVRFDTKVTRPFIRGREFLWQEGHTAHATQEDARKWVDIFVGLYAKVYESLGMEALILVRPKSDTFPGADFSVVFDTVMKDGRVIQGPDCHMLGQHFSKPFNITFVDEHQEKKHVWQLSWGMTTRQIGAVIMHHGDDRGAFLPPAIAPHQVVVVPILFKDSEAKVMKQSQIVADELKKQGIRVYLDKRNYTAGYKFNEWELKGVPLRIEVGPKDVETKHVTCVGRDGQKTQLVVTSLHRVRTMLDELQNDMLKRSKAFLKKSTADVTTLADLKNIFGFARANWCNAGACEADIKARSGGYEIRGTLFGKEEKPFANCIGCGKKAASVVYVAKAY